MLIGSFFVSRWLGANTRSGRSLAAAFSELGGGLRCNFQSNTKNEIKKVSERKKLEIFIMSEITDISTNKKVKINFHQIKN